MTREQAKRASETLEDVFTNEGDAVVIDQLRGNRAFVTPLHAWFLVADLTAREDLLK